MKISANTFVSLTYDLNVGEGDDRELMERAPAEAPLEFIYGTGTMLPAFETQLTGLAAGDTFEFTLAPADAYGERIAEHVVELPKQMFEVDGEFDSEYVVEGATLPMMDDQGARMNGSVLEVKDDVVIMDFNHPLAGETLHFNGSILEVRPATAAEIAALAHGGGGCGGGCGCGDHDHHGHNHGGHGCGGGCCGC